jgi:AcrR family transcriptional regulator
METPMSTQSRSCRRSREDSAKRRQIIEGARAVFLPQGFDAASMGEIARKAGVSKGTLYVYFKSKEDLFEAIAEEQCSQQAEQVFELDDAITMSPAC